MKYQIVESSSRSSLEHGVNLLLSDGWVPLGAPYTYTEPHRNWLIWCQAMTKETA